eukprot:m.31844 g.31844  ORF g.31844 m.31844 type:complete len:175 (+) comp31562_c0_seq1:15-539(+)
MTDWILDHPVAAKMAAFDFKNENQLKVAMLVYLDLCEAKGWEDVQTHGCKELDVIYLTAQEKQDDAIEVVIPIPVDFKLSMAAMQDLLKFTARPDRPKSSTNKMILAIAESTSTIVYYYIHEGLCPPSEASLSRKIVQPTRKAKKHKTKADKVPAAKKMHIEDVNSVNAFDKKT